MAPCYFAAPRLPIRELLRSWLEVQKIKGMREDVAELIWLLAFETDNQTLTELALPIVTRSD